MEPKSITYNVEGFECMFMQRTPQSRTMEVFIDGKYRGHISITEIIGEYL
jgi:hypothetical protein